MTMKLDRQVVSPGGRVDQRLGGIAVLAEPLGGHHSNLLPVAISHDGRHIASKRQVAPHGVVRHVESESSEIKGRRSKVHAQLSALVLRDVKEVRDDHGPVRRGLPAPVGVGRSTIHAHVRPTAAETIGDVRILLPGHAAIHTG